MKLSIIVVTWNNENFIEQALKSCIEQTFTDYEVIVVHNASTDRTGELIRRTIAGYEDRFKVVENEKNEGLGEARNIGMRHANGDYLMFLDGDDFYQPGAFTVVARLLNTHKPDVLVFNYQKFWDTGAYEANGMTHLLTERDISSPRDRKKVLMNMSSSSNKAYKRQLICDLGATFPKGFYEDIVFSFKTLYAAKKCYVSPRVIFNYRQRIGSITKTVDDRHLDIIQQYRTLIEYLAQNPVYNTTYGKETYKYGRSQMLNVMNRGTRLPRNKQSEFLKLTGKLLEEWRSLANIKNPDILLNFAKFGNPSLYKLAKRIGIASYSKRQYIKYKAKTVKLKLKTLKDKIEKLKRNNNRLFYRYAFKHLPLNTKKVYFESYWGDKADCNPLAIAHGLKKQNTHEIIWGKGLNNAFPEDFPFKTVKKGSLAYYYAIATSGTLVSNVNLEGEIIKRKGAIHLQTQHGTPLKTMGVDVRRTDPKSMNWRALARRCRKWDYVISSNFYSSAIWRKAMPYDYRIIETGYPRNDIFFNYKTEDVVLLKKKLGIPSDKKVALYAPTWRDLTAEFPSPVPIMKIKKALGEEYVLLVRAHNYNNGAKFKPSTGIIDVSEHSISNEICLVSDLLITDYSSIMFDFACLKRPIVLFCYDYDQYIRKRGAYMDIRTQLPGEFAITANEFLKVLENKTFNSPQNIERITKFNQHFCSLEDGNATERVIKEVFN